jgi:hypothetical protein
MYTFPLSKWVGGIFYEHSHRLVASFVGLPYRYPGGLGLVDGKSVRGSETSQLRHWEP